jgi:hypothetical protein
MQQEYPPRPEGENWVHFGTHADVLPCPYRGKLDFGPNGDDDLPDWERHADGSVCVAVTHDA